MFALGVGKPIQERKQNCCMANEIKNRIKELRQVKASELLANPRNWRRHPAGQAEALRGALTEIGYADALIAYETPEGLMLIDGHLRAETTPDIEVPVLVTDLNEQEANLVLATLDPLAAMAVADLDLYDSLRQATAVQNDSLGAVLEAISDNQLEALSPKSVKSKAELTNPDDVPAQTEALWVETGDLYQLGNHRILCGDSTEEQDVARLMQGQVADCIWTDPPYAIYGSSSGISSSVADDKMVRPMFEAILRVSANTVKVFGHVYICSDWRSWPSWWEMAKRTPLIPKNCIIWDKGGGGMGNNYANTYEMVGFYTNMPERKAMASNEQQGQRPVFQPNMVRVNRVFGEERQHNASKPVDLISFNIKPSTDEGGLVVDWFLGSGSTLITAEKLGRVCYGMEIDPQYVQVTIERWQNYTGQKAVKL